MKFAIVFGVKLHFIIIKLEMDYEKKPASFRKGN